MSLKRVEERIWENICAVDDMGYTLIQRGFGNKENKTCCALTAVVIASTASFNFLIDDSGNFKMWAARKAAGSTLSKSSNWIAQFMNGWDNHVPSIELGNYKKAWRMGRRLHCKWMANYEK